MVDENGFAGVWGTFHIIYFVFTLVLLVVGLILIKRYVKDENRIRLLVKITAATLLALIITNRIAYTYQYIADQVEGFNWSYLLPETFCAVTAFSLSIAVLCCKKDNILFHGLLHMAIVGAAVTYFYPDFLDNHPLYELGPITSFIYHTVMLFLALLMIVTRYVNLTPKKWYMHPLTFMVMICYGLFYDQVLPHSSSLIILGINNPLMKSQPILTSWWMIGIGYLLFEIVFLALYDHFANKNDFKTIGDEFIHFYRYINQ